MTSKTILIDTSEKNPWPFKGYKTESISLRSVGSDYTIRGYSKVIGVERKAMPDFLNRIKNSYAFDIFLRLQVSKLLKLKYKAIIVEGHPGQVNAYREIVKATQEDVINRAIYVTLLGCPVIFAGNRNLAELACIRFLFGSLERLRTT